MSQNKVESEEQEKYFRENFPELASKLDIVKSEFVKFAGVINLNKSKEENEILLNQKLEEIIENISFKNIKYKLGRERSVDDKNLFYATLMPFSKFIEKFSKFDENLKIDLECILNSSSDEKIARYNIPIELYLKKSFRLFMRNFGIDTVMEYDREHQNILSKNNFKLIEDLGKYYLNYSSRDYKENENIYGAKDFSDKNNNCPYTKNEFENAIISLIAYGPIDGSKSKEDVIDTCELSKECINKVYDKLFESLEEISIKFSGSKDKINMIKETFRKYPIMYLKKILQMPTTLVNFQDEYFLQLPIDEIENWLLIEIKKEIVNGSFPYTENESSIIKEKIPELYLALDAPNDLKNIFYRNPEKNIPRVYGGFDFDGLNNCMDISIFLQSKYIKYIRGKSLEAVKKDFQLVNLSSVFSTDEIIDLIYFGIDDIENFDNQSYENKYTKIKKVDSNYKNLLELSNSTKYVQRFKILFSKYPKKYAIKELCKEYNISDNELNLDSENIKKEFEEIENKMREMIFYTPELSMYFLEEKWDDVDFSKYEELKILSEAIFSNNSKNTVLDPLKSLNNKIIWRMYGYLGYDNCIKLFENHSKNNYNNTSQDNINKLLEIFVNFEIPYSEDFPKFFMHNKNEILSNPLYVIVILSDLLNQKEVLNNFYNTSEFKTFHSNFEGMTEEINKCAYEEKRDFYKFAKVLGCFCNEKLLNQDGKELETTVGQKASSILARLVKTKELSLGKYHQLFDVLNVNASASPDFLEFISNQQKKGAYNNLELLVGLESEYPGIFSKAITDFEKVKLYRTTIQDGATKKRSWRDCLIEFYKDTRYIGVTDKTRDIANCYNQFGLEQEFFDEAVSLREEAEEKQIKEHLLDRPIREESILESIERIKENTEHQLENGNELINQLYKKQFTYEWLSKRAPENGILGAYCSCCATLKSSYYGSKIAKDSIVSNDIQNLVVRNNKGEIVAKGSLYLNRELGYGVINDFEVNDAYRQTEINKGDLTGGRYTGDYLKDELKSEKEKKEDRNRALIFEALIRGLNSFIEEYDKQNPNNPIKQVNVGMGYNKLKKQVEQFKQATNCLKVPKEYEFRDAYLKQFILYERMEKDKDINSIREDEVEL